ncbi:MAG TPA: acyl-ACP--UDP-N-acetylglucosamine O-acyltransferase [Candidatus Eisenbacteria bacterium]|jgi:UDP-N-acetylglucosamine acyltransferase
MTVRIHPAAFVDPHAQLGADVVVGPGSVVGPHVVIGDRTRIDAHALVTGWTTLGADNHVHHGAVLGSPPQDLKYGGEPSYLTVGDHNVFREYVTANLATEPGASTRIGCHGLYMAYSHVAHNCALGDRVVIANAVQMAGYVVVDDWAIIGGGTVVHQFTRIGRHCMIGGGSRISQDIAPFVRTAGSPPRNAGVNTIGLERRGFPREVREALERAYRIFFRDGGTASQAVETIRRELPGVPEAEHFARFCETSVRGITR